MAKEKTNPRLTGLVIIYLELCYLTMPLHSTIHLANRLTRPILQYPQCRLSACLHRAHLGCLVSGNGLYNFKPSTLQCPAMQTHDHSSAASAVPYVSQQKWAAERRHASASLHQSNPLPTLPKHPAGKKKLAKHRHKHNRTNHILHSCRRAGTFRCM
jgi:hypothetical protein